MLKKSGLLAFIGLALLLIIAGQVSALDLDNVDGVWTAINNGGSEPVCLRYRNTPAVMTDENLVAYGDDHLIAPFFGCSMGDEPALDRQSGFGFDGSDGLADFVPGEAFYLGEFTHYNNPLYPNLPAFSSARLRVDLNFAAPLPDTSLNYTFRLDETNNDGACEYGPFEPYDGVDCNDRVTFENAIVQDTFVINGVAYTLQVVGFIPGRANTCQFDEDDIATAFITAERATNHACLFGRVLVAEPAITLTKTLDQTNPVAIGSAVTFTIRVQNSGNTLLRNIDLQDTLSIGGSCNSLMGPESDLDNNTTLSAGETWTYICHVNDVNADFVNNASVEAVAIVNNNRLVVMASGDAEVTVQPSGTLAITKQVDWSGAPAQEIEFEICVTGPSFQDEHCDAYSPGETTVFNGMIPGDYTVTERDLGAAWAIAGSPTTVTVEPNRISAVIVTNTLRRGSLTVRKVVDWSDTPPTPDIAFTLCIAGPSYPTGGEPGACQTVIGADGGELFWGDLLTGSYAVREADPGSEWTITYSPEMIFVPAGGSAAATVTNSHISAPTCEGRDLRIDLEGGITPGEGIATGAVTNVGDARCAYQIGMASYKRYNEVIDDQEIFAWTNPTFIIAPGETVILLVGLPPCSTQVDLFYGEYLPNLAGVRYGERLLQGLNLGDDFCLRVDTDGDGIDDALDPDDDNDGIMDESDSSSLIFNDIDGDGIGDGLDADMDGDSMNNDVDPLPATFGDLDGDGIGDGADEDADGDGFSNVDEAAAGTNFLDASSFPAPPPAPPVPPAPEVTPESTPETP